MVPGQGAGPTGLTGALRRDGTLAGLVFLAVGALTVAVQTGRMPAYDTKIMYAVTRALAHGRLHILPGDDVYHVNVPYSHYGIAESLFMLPFYVVQRALHTTYTLVVTLTNPVELAVAAALLYAIGRELRWSRRWALVPPLAFAWLTMALQASTDQLSEPGIALSTALALLGVLRWRRGARWTSGPALAGLGLGLAVLFREDSLITVGVPLAVALPFVLTPRRLRADPARLLLFALPVLLAVGWTLYYSELRDHTLLPRPYGGHFSYPLLSGLNGLLFSPGKGFFLFNPVLVLAVPGVVLLARKERALAGLIILLVLVRVVFFARWSAWYGGVCWGPRFLMPLTLPLSLTLVPFLVWLGRLPLVGRLVGYLLTVAGVAGSSVVSVASVWINYAHAYAAVLRPPRGLSGPGLTQWYLVHSHLYYWSWSDSAIGWNLRHLAHTPYWAMAHFNRGVDPAGVVGLVLAVAVPVLAFTVAGGGRRRGRRPASRVAT